MSDAPCSATYVAGCIARIVVIYMRGRSRCLTYVARAIAGIVISMSCLSVGVANVTRCIACVVILVRLGCAGKRTVVAVGVTVIVKRVSDLGANVSAEAFSIAGA